MSKLLNVKQGAIADLNELYVHGAPVATIPTRGNVFYLDPVNGNDGNDGKSPVNAFLTLAVAYAALTANQNDVLFVLGGASALNPATAIVWAKSYTHLIGVTNGLPGMGQRARIVNTAANDLPVLFTLSGNGCLIAYTQFFDGKDKAEDGACVLNTGNNNHFVKCQIAGMGDATASGPATRAGSYSLKITGEQTTVADCSIGLDTVVRSAANTEVVVAGPRTKFINCDIRSNSVTAGKTLVTIDNSGGDLCDTQFWDCLFFNYTENWATGITNVFDMPTGGNTHYVILRGDCQIVGVGTGWADVVTAIYGAGAVPNAGYGISINPTT